MKNKFCLKLKENQNRNLIDNQKQFIVNAKKIKQNFIVNCNYCNKCILPHRVPNALSEGNQGKKKSFHDQEYQNSDKIKNAVK